MSDDTAYSAALGELRSLGARFKPGQKFYDDIVLARDQVFARYGPLFSSERIPTLSKEEFTSFLYIQNNHHWTGLYRHGLKAAADVRKLRATLATLLDESQPIRTRLPDSLDMLPGFGKALATAVLTIAYPEKYGVWNSTSEAALRQLHLWPDVAKGAGIGERYDVINGLMVRLCADLGLDLWTLDALWWYLLEGDQVPTGLATPADGPTSPGGDSFALERQLQDFLLENWEQTALGKTWNIYATPDDPEAGYEFPTDVGRIDLLAKHKREPRYLVVELKRRQTSDQTVGQALRYVGWVRRHLAKPDEQVEALIIAQSADKEIRYALSATPDIRLMTYEVEFRLKVLPSLQ